MKHFIYIISFILIGFFASCSDEEVLTAGQNEEPGKCSITLSLSIDTGKGLSVDTRSGISRAGTNVQPVDLEKYDVYMYWFEGTSQTDPGNPIYTYQYSKKIEDNYVTIEGLTEGTPYAYVFLSALKNSDGTKVINPENIKDLYTASSDDASSFSGNSTELIENTSNLKNCFISFFENDTEIENQKAETLGFNATRNLQIYADGATILAGTTSTTPNDLVLSPQFGVIQIQSNSMNFVGKTISCVVYSDFYRLYFSQMVRGERTEGEDVTITRGYSSLNEGQDQTGLITNGDYFSSSYYKDYPAALKWEKSVAATDVDENGDINIYLPYTTANKVGKRPTNEQEYVNTNSIAYYQADYPISFTIDGQTYNYETEKTFPIYRGGISSFYIDGTKLGLKLGDEGGIDIDNDEWDGVVTNQ